MRKVIQPIINKFNSTVLNYKRSKLIKLYNNKNYEKAAKMFKTKADYSKIKIDEFPYVYFLISTQCFILEARETKRPSEYS